MNRIPLKVRHKKSALFILLRRLVFLISLILCIPAIAQKTDSCFVGLYVKALYDLSPSDFSFGADFYIWSNSSDSAQLFNKLEVINAKRIDEYSPFVERDGKRFVSYKNCKAQLTHNWELKNYPFDKQKLEIAIEAQNNTEIMWLADDQSSFQLTKGLKIPGWKVKDNFIKKALVKYPSNFGYRQAIKNEKSYNQLCFVIELERNSWGIYFKLFMGLYIAFLVSFLAFFIQPDFVDPRFGVSIGGLFASVANKYVVDANIPATIGFSFVDMVHFLSFVFIFATIVLSTISLRIHQTNGRESSRKFDKRAALSVFLLYLFLNILLIALA